VIQDVRSCTLDEPPNVELRLPFDEVCLGLAVQRYHDLDKAIEAHSRTIIADRRGYIGNSEVGRKISPSDLRGVYAIWRMHLKGQPPMASLSPEDEEALSEFECLSDIATRRTYIGTVDGRVGLAPIEAQVGDLICILYGANTPYLVRRSEKENPYPLRLVGDAYVHGLMYGEALLMPERQFEGDIVIS
jgi:hypothetical protein